MLREKVQPFKLQVEEVSGSSIRYLDLLLTKTGTRFVARPAFKTTSLARPLDPTSAHPKFVHCSWQLEWSNAFSQCVVARLMSCLAKKSSFPAFRPTALPSVPSHVFVKASPWPERKVPRVSGVSSVLWAVFGFHPGLQKELSHALCRVLGGSSCGFVRETWPLFPEIRDCVFHLIILM